MKNEIDTNISEQELTEIRNKLQNILENGTSTIANQVQKFSEEIGKVVTSEKLNEYTKIFEEMQAASTQEMAEKIKSTILEEILPKLSAKYTNLSEIEILKSIIPKNFYIANNKLANEITKSFLNKGEQELIVMKNVRKKGDIITYNTLTYDDKNITIAGKYEFTAYDRAIHNAVCSLYVAGNDIVTPAMVYRAMNGMTETEYVSPQAQDAVRNSIDKSRVILLKVDFTEEAKARGLNVDKTTIESYLLNADKIEVKVGANEIEGYKINKIPVLYQYAQNTKQILSIPLKLLDTSEATRNTEDIIPIKEYLIRRIEIMKHDRTMNNKILYSTIFKEAGVTINSYTERDRYRKYIKEILNLWKNRDGYIRDFSEYKERNSITGLEIVINKKRSSDM